MGPKLEAALFEICIFEKNYFRLSPESYSHYISFSYIQNFLRVQANDIYYV